MTKWADVVVLAHPFIILTVEVHFLTWLKYQADVLTDIIGEIKVFL